MAQRSDPKRRRWIEVSQPVSYRTEEAYVGWIRRFILFHGKRHPAEMGKTEVETFLSSLAIDAHVSASTRNQAQRLCPQVPECADRLGLAMGISSRDASSQPSSKKNPELLGDSHRPVAVARTVVSCLAMRRHGLAPSAVAAYLGVSRFSVVRGFQRAQQLGIESNDA